MYLQLELVSIRHQETLLTVHSFFSLFEIVRYKLHYRVEVAAAAVD